MNYKSINPAYRFLAILLVLYLVFNYFNIGFNALVSPQGKHFQPFIYHNLNYIKGYTNVLTNCTAYLFLLINKSTYITESVVQVKDGYGVNVQYSCLGFGLLSLILAFTIAYPAKLKSKIKILLLAISMLFITNVLRISILLYVINYIDRGWHYRFDHHDVYNLIIYLLISLLFYLWVRKQKVEELKFES